MLGPVRVSIQGDLNVCVCWVEIPSENSETPHGSETVLSFLPPPHPEKAGVPQLMVLKVSEGQTPGTSHGHAIM